MMTKSSPAGGSITCGVSCDSGDLVRLEKSFKIVGIRYGLWSYGYR